MTDAREGDVAVQVTCGCEGATLVREYRLDEFRCGSCRRKGTPTGLRVTLGPDGSLPVDWRDQPTEAAA